jgi:diaminopimelate decarboxylase
MREVLDAGGVVNLDSFHEIEWLRKNRSLAGEPWKVGLRLNCDLERHCPGETAMGDEPGRFGFNLENGSFYEAARQIKELGHVRITGVHTHHSSSTKSMRVFEALGRLTFESLKIIGHDLEFIDMGGGFFSGKIEYPDYARYAQIFLAPLRELLNPEKTSLIIEPGAAIVFSPFSYVCSVIDTKEVAGVTIVSTDGSALWFDFGLIGRRFPAEGRGSSNVKKARQVIVGYSGLERDWMGEFSDQPAFIPGDAISFRNVGAYTLALAPLFIQLSPAIIVKHAEGFFYAKEAWGVEEFVQRCLMYDNQELPNN